jgi:hypothetical protein
MKVIINKNQYNLILEQGGLGIYGTPGSKSLEQGNKSIANLDPHTLMTILGIGTAFIPVVGPFISAGIGLVEAGMYYNEGDKKTAGITGALSILPFIGLVASKIPGIRQLGAKGMAILAGKLSKGGKNLTKVELEIANALKLNETLIKNELSSAGKTLGELTQSINKLKPEYINRFGRKSYDELLENLLTKKISKQIFLKKMMSSKNASPKLANFVSKFGIKFSKNELSQIHEYTNFVKKLPTKITGGLLNSINPKIRVMTKEGPKSVSLKFISSKRAVKLWGENFKDSYGAAWGDDVYFIVDNVKKMSPGDIDQLFYHEFAHIKDPSFVSTKLDKLYKSDVKRYSPEYFSKGYYFHPRELVANTAKILNGLSTNTNKIMKSLGKEKTLRGLDDLINWSKGTKKDFTDEMTKLLGYTDPFVKEHFTNLLKNTDEYRKLVTKVAQQAEYLKSQVKLAL